MVRGSASLLKIAPAGLSATLADILVCPLSKQPLRPCGNTNSLISDSIGVSYPIVEGIPRLVPADGKMVDSDEDPAPDGKMVDSDEGSAPGGLMVDSVEDPAPGEINSVSEKHRMLAHVKKWENSFAKPREPIAERGVTLTRDAHPEVWALVDHYQWHKLMEVRGVYDQGLVKHFYALYDMYDAATGHIRLRGANFFINSKMVNKFYGIPIREPSEDDFLIDDPSDFTREEVRRLCKSGVHLPERSTSIEKRHLNVEARIWMQIVQSVLMPCQNIRKLMRLRAKLVYAILTRRPINVGDVIMSEIKAQRSDYHYKLPFACLLTAMARDQGVPTYPNHFLVKERGTIDDASVRRFAQVKEEAIGRGPTEKEEVDEEEYEARRDEERERRRKVRVRTIGKGTSQAIAGPSSRSSRGQERLMEDISRDIRGYIDERCREIEDMIHEEHAWHRGEYLALHMRIDAMQRQGDLLPEMDLRECEHQERRRRRRHLQQHELDP